MHAHEPRPRCACKLVDAADSQDAVGQIAMHHFALSEPPQWARMDSISSAEMRIRYVPGGRKYVPGAEETYPTGIIRFEPPLESGVDAKNRIIELNSMSVDANEKVLAAVRAARETANAQKAGRDNWDKYNVDVLLHMADSVLSRTCAAVFGRGADAETLSRSWLRRCS